jgi:hypothetical protein
LLAAEECELDHTRKLEWYNENGIKLEEEGGGPDGTLVTFTETEGIDHSQARLIRKIKTGG